MASWNIREVFRFRNGTYQTFPQEVWTKLNQHNVMLCWEHYIHLSTQRPDMVAYTQSDAHGEEDRQTLMRFGRYLKRYHPLLSDKQVEELAGLLRTRKDDSKQNGGGLHLATDRETIKEIFETPLHAGESAPVSCMCEFDTWTNPPYMVYAGSPDVAIAYLRESSGIIARTVVSTKYKWWVRMYTTGGDDHEYLCSRLREALHKAGYERRGSLKDCRLSVLEEEGHYALPYIDGSAWYVYQNGDYWVVTDNDEEGEYSCQETSGRGDEVERTHCANCEEIISQGDEEYPTVDGTVCSDCIENYIRINDYNRDGYFPADDCSEGCDGEYHLSRDLERDCHVTDCTCFEDQQELDLESNTDGGTESETV